MKITGFAFSGPIDFECIGTGGGCEALSASMEDDFHIFISDEASRPSADSKSVDLWVEDDNGKIIFTAKMEDGGIVNFGSMEAKCQNGTLKIIYG